MFNWLPPQYNVGYYGTQASTTSSSSVNPYKQNNYYTSSSDNHDFEYYRQKAYNERLNSLGGQDNSSTSTPSLAPAPAPKPGSIFDGAGSKRKHPSYDGNTKNHKGFFLFGRKRKDNNAGNDNQISRHNARKANRANLKYQNAPSYTPSSNLINLGYDASKGKNLANIAMRNHVGFVGYCAKYVKNAMQQAGLGGFEAGHAFNMVDILSNNKNFKRIPSSTNVKDLPAGCIIVYGKGVAGYSRQYGHVEISTGTGKAVSDGITNNVKQNPTAIFIPV